MPSIYDYPLYYDIAFQRDLEPDLTFLVACMNLWRNEPVQRILELGCGPAYHARALAKRDYHVTGLDLSIAMLEYAAKKAREEQVEVEFVSGNMSNFKLTTPVDMVLSMMATVTHIMTMDQMVEHLRTVAGNLTSDGLYILELPHPRDLFSRSGKRATHPTWHESRDGITVDMVWGEDHDPVNSVMETRTFQVEMTVTEHDVKTMYRFEELQAIWTPKEMEAAIKLSGCFEVCAMYGEFDIDQAFNNSKWSWRMIPVLKVVKA